MKMPKKNNSIKYRSEATFLFEGINCRIHKYNSNRTC